MSDRPQDIRLVVLEPDSHGAAVLREALSRDENMRLQAVVSTLDSLFDEISATRPDVIVADLGSLGDPAEGVRDLLMRSPDACLIVTGADASPGSVSRAVTAGARGFVLKPFQGDDLLQTVKDAYGNLWKLRRLQRVEQVATNHAEPAAGTRGAVIAVYGPKGGVGCTTIATSLAVALASGKKRVALIDLDLQFGDVGVALDLHGANSVEDLVAHAAGIDATLISELLVRHSSGVRALLAPDNVLAIEDIDAESIVSAIDGLRPHFDYIVCDLWSTLDELTLGTLRIADRTVLVSTPELPALRNLGRVMGGIPAALLDHAIVVVNRHPGKAGVSLAEIQKSLGRPVAATIPSDGVGVTQAINQGISLFDSRARVRSGRSYKRLAQSIAHDLESQPAPIVGRLASTA
jgi:pilus assembly protein CpaE